MNPRLILLLFLVLGSKGGVKNPSLPSFPLPSIPKGPAYIDTFKMEMALDRLHAITDALDKINGLNQTRKVPTPPQKPVPKFDRVHGSLDAVKGLLADSRQGRQVETISNTLSGIKNLGNLDELASVLGPILASMKD